MPIPSEVQPDALLLALDFDKTMARTDESGPGIKTVEGAYMDAVEAEFGISGLSRYLETGGLNNDAPGEVVLRLAPELARSREEHHTKTEQLVASKMHILIDQVCDTWPRPVRGFMPVWESVSQQPHIDTAVVSSGHTDFINRVLDGWGVDRARIVVSDDDLRNMDSDIPYAMMMKPHPFSLELAIQQWGDRIAVDPPPKERVLYAGDDLLSKDGPMAEAAGVQFVHINPDEPWWGYREVAFRLGLEDPADE